VSTGGVIAVLVGLYLLLMARSAWKQGELRQFLLSLALVAGLLGGLFVFVEGWIWWDRGW